MEELTGREDLTPVGKQMKMAGHCARWAAVTAVAWGAFLMGEPGWVSWHPGHDGLHPCHHPSLPLAAAPLVLVLSGLPGQGLDTAGSCGQVCTL